MEAARLALNNLARLGNKKTVRVGRGRSSRRPRTSGRGMIGQKQRETVPPGFEGGQTPFWLRAPKHGVTRREPLVQYETLNLWKLQEYVKTGKIDASKPIDMVTLIRSNIVNDVRTGIKLLGGGQDEFESPLHIRVSQASKAAIAAVEKAGGKIECVHYNPVNINYFRKPEKFLKVPRPGLPRSGLRDWYQNPENRGYLSATTAKAALDAVYAQMLARNAELLAERGIKA